MARAPELKPHPAYAEAFAEIMRRVQKALGSRKPVKPVVIAVAGGAALHFYTASRISQDVDASLLARVLLDPADLRVSYKDADGGVKMLYYDTQYNDSLALMHEDAYDDALPVHVEGVDRERLDVRLLSPLDLAVSKLSRFSEQDREDIRALAAERLITAAGLKKRAAEALPGYVGNLTRIRNTIEIAARDVEAITQAAVAPKGKRPPHRSR
jgi:hypothetical protein